MERRESRENMERTLRTMLSGERSPIKGRRMGRHAATIATPASTMLHTTILVCSPGVD